MITAESKSRFQHAKTLEHNVAYNFLGSREMDSRTMIDTAAAPAPRAWDARLARWLVTPLKDTSVTPNHLTTLRLVIGIAGAACLAQGGFGWANAGAVLIVLSNFIDHEIDPVLRAEIEAHLKTCHRCSVLHDSLRKILIIVADERTFEIPVGYSERLHAFIDQHL